jgi:hypothetical protein
MTDNEIIEEAIRLADAGCKDVVLAAPRKKVFIGNI